MSPKTPQPPKSLVQTVLALSKTPQLYWFAAHVFSVFSFIGFILVGFFSSAKALSYYRYMLFFQLVSYAIVIKQVHSPPKSRNALIRDENVQYFLFALVLWVVSFKIGTAAGTPHSYLIFLVFHAASYFQTHLLEALPVPISTQAAINARIAQFSSSYTQQGLFFAAASEVMMISNFLWQIPGFLLSIFRAPLFAVVQALTAIAVVVFVKLRYNESQNTKTVVQQFDAKVTGILSYPVVPPQLSLFYHTTFKALVARYIAPIQIPSVSVAKKTQ